MKTVLILSTYPVGDARHGGQVRLANIIAAYQRDGWNVRAVCVYPEEGYPKHSDSHSIKFPQNSPFRMFGGQRVPFIDDLLTGDFATSEEIWERLLAIMPDTIDAVHVEQPWLWPVAVKLRELPAYRDAALVYGAANIEAELKRDILRSYSSEETERALAAIDDLERFAARTADLVVAVTESEGRVLAAWGARKIVLAANGITPWVADPEALAEWRQRLPRAPWLLYVASEHPPNFSAFADLVGGSLGCFPPDSGLVVAGGVTEHIYHQLNTGKWRGVSLSRLKLLFSLSDRNLAAVKTLAHGFFLPVAYGSGSNIKTAEALLSGKYVIGTSVAFRGFEAFRDLPELRVADTPRQVHAAVREVLSLPPTAGAKVSRQSLTWEHSLRHLSRAVNEVVTSGAARAIA